MADKIEEPVFKTKGLNVGSMKRAARRRILNLQDTRIGGCLLKHRQITKIGDGHHIVSLHKLPDFVAIPRPHPFVGQDVAELAAGAEHFHAALDEVDV